MSRLKAPVSEEIRVRGFARLQIHERRPDGTSKIVGDSGWIKNTVTNGGRDKFIAAKVGDVTGSKLVSFMQLATQSTAVDATQTILVGATRTRKAINRATAATGTLRMTASWASGDNPTAITIGSIGLYDISETNSSELAAGQTFTTSQWNSNQDLSATYEWRF